MYKEETTRRIVLIRELCFTAVWELFNRYILRQFSCQDCLCTKKKQHGALSLSENYVLRPCGYFLIGIY